MSYGIIKQIILNKVKTDYRKHENKYVALSILSQIETGGGGGFNLHVDVSVEVSVDGKSSLTVIKPKFLSTDCELR